MAKTKETQSDLFAEYTEIVGNTWEVWKPYPGDSIEGKIVKRHKGNFGESYIIENIDGQFILPNHQMLERLLDRCMIGDRIRVVRGDSIKTGNEKTINVYKVFLKKAV